LFSGLDENDKANGILFIFIFMTPQTIAEQKYIFFTIGEYFSK